MQTRVSALGLRAQTACAAVIFTLLSLAPRAVQADVKLTVAGLQPGAEFGRAVAINAQAALVGVPSDSEVSATAGAAYVFEPSSVYAAAPQKLLPDGLSESYFFGNAVALDGDTAVVGAYGDGQLGSFAGAVYVYVRNGATWTLQQKLFAADAGVSQFFGYSVAIAANTIVVGALGDATRGTKSGAGYVFVRSGTSWSQQQKIVPTTLVAYSNAGAAVAVDADTLLLGAIGDVDNDNGAGSTYVFTRTGVNWSQQQKLVATTGSINDLFGSTLALVANTAVVGALGDDQVDTDAGAAHVYVRNGTTWTLQKKLLGEHGGDGFGYGVALQPKMLVVGAATASDRGPAAGAAYLFAGPDWNRSYKLLASDASENALFGFSVAVRDDRALIGANGDPGGNDSGAAYVFGISAAQEVPALGSRALAALVLMCVLLALSMRRRGALLRASAQLASVLALSTLYGCDAPEATAANEGPVAALERSLASPDTLTFLALRDATVRGSAPNDNFGASGVLDLNRALIAFDAAAVGAAIGSQDYVLDAKLELSLVRSSLRRTPRVARAYRLTQAWTESGVTWNCATDSDPSDAQPDCSGGTDWSMDTAPNPWALPASSQVTIPVSLSGNVKFDVSADVRALVSGQQAHQGWMIRGDAVGERDEFTSRESSTPPRLILQVRRCSAALCDDANVCTSDSCDAIGQCVHTPVANGVSCSDGNACTQSDTCQAGVCSAGSAVTCVASDACHVAGSCNPLDGTCSNPAAPNGTACNDSNACTQSDSCQAGLCLGTNPVVCASVDLCHPSVCNPSGGSCNVSTACTLYGIGSIPSNTNDGLVLSPTTLQSGLPNNRIGAFGSAISYTGVGNLYVATPDRGPNDGNDSYTDRYYQFEITLNAGTVTPHVIGAATLNQGPGVTFTGLSSQFDATNSPNSRRLDPEAVRVTPSGTFFTSDEYGPFVYEFSANGDRLRALTVPSKFLIDNPSATAELPPANTKGRQLNRGMEGLAITPDGTKLYGLMQNPLIQDGALNASNGRIGLNVRLLEITPSTGATREFLYQLSDRTYGLNEIVAINDHQFLAIERDGAAGASAAFKRLFFIDIASATDISGIEPLPTSGTPAGVIPVQKQAFLNLLAPEYGLAGPTFPEKIEGLTFGPDLPDGRHVLIVTNDNDFLAANSNNFYVFAIGQQVLQYVATQSTFSSACASVTCTAVDECHLPGSCNPGTGSCSTPPAAAGTPASMQTAGDCQKRQCDGNGQIVSVADDTDAVDDGNTCTSDVCVNGVPSHPPVPLGTACNQAGGNVCNGSGSCVECVTPTQCPGVDSECASRTCTDGACGIAYAPSGTTTASQVTGDCQRNQCDGADTIVAVADDNDVPNDGNQCTNDVCTSGVPSNPPAPQNTPCSGGLCDGQGVCSGGCTSAAQCPGNDTFCAARSCVNGSCGFDYTAAGTALPSQNTGDCQVVVCDGAGGTTSTADNGDVPNDSNSCTNDTCTAGVPSYVNKPAATVCSDNGGQVCDGNGACTFYTFRVVHIGTGAGAPSSAATPVFLEEWKTNGTFVGSISLPTNVNGSQRRLTMSGTASSEGALSRSADGRYIVLGGYDAAVGTVSIKDTLAVNTNRVIGRIDALGNVDTTTALTNAFSADNFRAATSLDGSAFWAAGNGASSTGGVYYAALGAATGTRLTTAPSNARTVNVVAGQLYGSAMNGTFTNVFSVGSGTPTTAGQTSTSFPGMPTATASPYAFALLDRNAGVAGVDTLYVADDRAAASGGGIQKWTFNGATWTLASTWASVTGFPDTGFRGVAANVTGSDVTLMATTATDNGNRLVLFVDNGGGAASGTVVTTAPTNTVFRGVAVSPHL